MGVNNLVLESSHASARELHEFLVENLGDEAVISSETIHIVDINKSVWDWELPVRQKEEKE